MLWVAWTCSLLFLPTPSSRRGRSQCSTMRWGPCAKMPHSQQQGAREMESHSTARGSRLLGYPLRLPPSVVLPGASQLSPAVRGGTLAPSQSVIFDTTWISFLLQLPGAMKIACLSVGRGPGGPCVPSWGWGGGHGGWRTGIPLPQAAKPSHCLPSVMGVSGETPSLLAC